MQLIELNMIVRQKYYSIEMRKQQHLRLTK